MVFMIVGIMAAVLILWIYHKHKTSHHTALGEGHSHAHTHSHPPPVKMCGTGDSTTHICSQINGVKKEKMETGSTGVTTHPAAYSSLYMSKSLEIAKPDTHLYDQVDKGKKSEVTTHPHIPEADTAVDHFYAVLEDESEVATHVNTPEADTTDHLYAKADKKKIKKKKATHPHTPEADTAVNQLCAQVDKNQKKEVRVPFQESGPVYSALNKPRPPQLPAKSDLLMEDLQTP